MRSVRARASKAAIFFSAALRLAASSAIRAGSWSRGVFSVVVSCETMARSAARSRNASRPTRASTRRFDAPTDDSPTRLTSPISALEETCVPAQSSRDHGPPMSTIRTVSPYFSPNRAIAPSDFASSSETTLGRDLEVVADGVVRDLLDLGARLGRQRLPPREVEAHVAGAIERARLRRALAERVAQRRVHEVRRGVRLSGGAAVDGIHDRRGHAGRRRPRRR